VDNEFPKRYNFEKWVSYIYRAYKYFSNYEKKNCELFYNLSLLTYQAVYERIEEILVENFNEENLNIKKKIRSNESIIKNLKGKPLSEMQECIHIANEIFKAVDFNNSNSECGLKIKMSFYELWGKIQSIEGQTIIVNESNTDTIICSLIETLRIENVHKSNLSKEKTNALLYKLINITKTIDIKNCATSVELWLLIVQSAINVNNFNVAFLCINNCFDNYSCIYNEEIIIENNFSDNYQRFWIIKALLKFNDLIHIMIENKNFYEKVNDMHMKALKYCIHALINLRYLSNLNSPLYKEIFFRIWNNILEIINFKESYIILQKYIEKIVEEVNYINSNKIESKNVFIHFSSDLVPIFIKIIETLYNISLFNNSKETSKYLIEKAFRSFPAQFHRDILELRVKYYYNNENGLISGAFHELEDDKQAELWNLLSSMEFLGNKKGYIAIQNSIRLSGDPIKKAEKMIRLADWMYKNEYDDAEINSVLTMASSLLGNIFENKESEIKLNEDSITSCTVEQLELIIKLYCIKILIHNSKKDVINMIRCCGYYVNHVAKKTYNEFIKKAFVDHEPEPKKKEKKKKEKKDSDTKNEDDELVKEKNKEKEKELFSSFSEKCGFFPSSEKEWLMFSWPSIITEYIISYDDQPEILCMRTLNNAIYLVAACLNIVIESITLGCFSYAVPFLWLSLHLTTYWLNGIEQSKALCIIYALYSYYANKFGFKNLYCEYYFNVKNELTNINFDIFDRKGYKRDPKILYIFNEIPFDIRSIYLQIANIYLLLNKDIWDIRFIIKNVVVNENISENEKSKYYFYKAFCEYYIMHRYNKSELECNKSIVRNCISYEKILAVIIKLWCYIRQLKFYKFLNGDIKKYIYYFVKQYDFKRCSSTYLYGLLYYYVSLTYTRVAIETSTEELYDDIFKFLEKAEKVFESQDYYLLLFECYKTHSTVLLKYINYNAKNTKESFIRSLDFMNKAEIVLNEYAELYKDTLNETIINNNMRMKLVEMKTTVFRKIYKYVDPIIENKEILNENIINNYLLNVDINKSILQKWKEINNNTFDEIMKYYKAYSLKDNKTSKFLYNCISCFKVFLKNKKKELPAICPNRVKNIKKQNSVSGIPQINNNSIYITETINSQILLNIYKEIINYGIKEQEYAVLRKASEELFYLIIDSSDVQKFM